MQCSCLLRIIGPDAPEGFTLFIECGKTGNPCALRTVKAAGKDAGIGFTLHGDVDAALVLCLGVAEGAGSVFFSSCSFCTGAAVCACRPCTSRTSPAMSSGNCIRSSEVISFLCFAMSVLSINYVIDAIETGCDNLLLADSQLYGVVALHFHTLFNLRHNLSVIRPLGIGLSP